jgi:phosphotransferase system  glucose/maltose/N-acetylglucosamine-specific IIC component
MKRVNTLVFVERMAGLVFAMVIAVLGLGLATYLALNDKQLVASVIGGATLVGLVVAFVGGKRAQDKKH